jgi:hypothetical protein
VAPTGLTPQRLDTAMEDRQGHINHLLDDLEPEQRDYLKQAIRDIATHSMAGAENAMAEINESEAPL